MTFDERVPPVAKKGFTERQARFLTTVMLHAGVQAISPLWLALPDAEVPVLRVGPRRLRGAAGVCASCLGIRRALRWLWSRK